MFELAPATGRRDVLDRRRARATQALRSLLTVMTLHPGHREARRPRPSPSSGWLHNRRSSGKIHFLQVRDGSGFIQAVMSKAAVGEELFKAAPITSAQETSLDVTGAVRADQRAPGGYELDVTGLDGRSRSARLPHHAEGARRGLPARSPPPLDPQPAAAGDPARAARGDQRGPRLLQRARLHPRRHARSSRRPRARARRRCSRCSTSKTRPRTSRRADSSTTKPTRWRSAGCTASGRRSAPRSRKTRRHLTEFWMVEPEMAYADARRRHRAGGGAGGARRRRACSTAGRRS